MFVLSTAKNFGVGEYLVRLRAPTRHRVPPDDARRPLVAGKFSLASSRIGNRHAESG